MFHDAGFFTLPIAVFGGGAFVVQLFAFGQADFQFGASVFPVQGQRNQGITFAFDRTDEFIQFMPVQQKFSGANGVRVNMCGCRQQRGNMSAE